MSRQQQPERVRVLSVRTGMIERRRPRYEGDGEVIDMPVLAAPRVAPRARTVVLLFLVFSAIGGLLVPALGLFDGAWR